MMRKTIKNFNNSLGNKIGQVQNSLQACNIILCNN